jgi:hypothetical protein
MDESFHTLEAELKALPLRHPSSLLLNRLEADLATSTDSGPQPRRYTTATNLNSWKWSGWRLAGLAAAFTLLATVGVLQIRRQPAPIGLDGSSASVVATPVTDSRHNHYQPISATNVLYDLTDEGPVGTSSDTLTRRVRARYLDTYTWKNPTTNASLRWSVPRDEIRLVSATLN